jgi:hypothetical protein
MECYMERYVSTTSNNSRVGGNQLRAETMNESKSKNKKIL